jgi:hypothetical protein
LTDIQLVIDILTILGAVGALIVTFFKYGWPRLTQLGARIWNWWLLRSISNKQPESQQNKYQTLETYKAIIERSKKHGLWKQHESTMQLEEYLKHRLRHVVRFFLLAESLDRERCTSLLLEQNTIQPLFQFELGHVDPDEETVEKRVCSIPPAKEHQLVAFIDKCQQILATDEWTHPKVPKPLEEPIRIVVTQAALPEDYYLWGHLEGTTKDYEPSKESWSKFKPDKFWVISLASLKQYLPDVPAEQFVLRVMQRSCVNAILPAMYSQNKKLPNPRLSHYNTNGCLFDFTYYLADTRYFVSDGFICEDCASEILKAKELPSGHRSSFLCAIQKWLDDTKKANLALKTADDTHKITSDEFKA